MGVASLAFLVLVLASEFDGKSTKKWKSSSTCYKLVVRYELRTHTFDF